MDDRIARYLDRLYGRRAAEISVQLDELLDAASTSLQRPAHAPAPGPGGLPMTQADAVMITYGDQFRRSDEPPLRTLGRFCDRYLTDHVSGVHILPFFPYSSDDGFSVMDYKSVNPKWGDWDDVRRITGRFRGMFDLVINHASARGDWFQRYLRGEDPYAGFFLEASPDWDLSAVVRPRALPLLTRFDTSRGERHLWTTFSADQIDLDFGNPAVLLQMAAVLLLYLDMGAQIIRLDAIAYLWKEVGTSCLHLEQTHLVVKLFRAVVERVAPWALILTETNVPHAENISYFGNAASGAEAHMVYQFSLPPLTMDAFLRSDTSVLSRWAAGLQPGGQARAFFNFTASHDGIGVTPAYGFLSEEQIAALADAARDRGGFVSNKSTPAGEVPYELNVSYYDAVAGRLDEQDGRLAFLTSQAIMLALAGVPGIYVHSLLGSSSATAEYERTGVKRSVNRKKLDYDTVIAALEDESSRTGAVFAGYMALLAARRSHTAFDPAAGQQVLPADARLFVVRRSAAGGPSVLCLHNASPDRVPLADLAPSTPARDLISGASVGGPGAAIDPWATLWLAESD